MADLPPGFGNVRPFLDDELGVTYLADREAPGDRQDGRHGQQVAVRVLSVPVPGRPARRQFRSACLVVGALAGQPGILAVHDVVFAAEHHPCLVTDPIAGTLATRLAGGPLSVAAAASLGVTLAGTLATAHAAGILHLDVRPSTIVGLTSRSTPALAHFGVTRALSAAGQAELPTECLVHAGRELFGWDTPGPPADVYGLGSALYSMLAGQAPYAAEARLGRAALYQRVLRGGPPAMAGPAVPASLTGLIAAMMDPDPGNRPGLADVSEMLGRHAEGQPGVMTGWEGRAAADCDARTPVTVAPVTVAPVTGAPVTGAPLASQPDASLPEVSLPDASLPEASLPEVSLPEASLPDASLPDASPLEVRLPGPALSGGRPANRPLETPARPDGRARPAGLMLLIAAGFVALLAGLVWGVVTRPPVRLPRPVPAVRATASASPAVFAQLARYRPERVRVVTRPGGVLVRWSAPASVRGVTAYLVVAELDGEARQEHTVGLATRAVVFSGLTASQRYCFVVGTLIESGSGRAVTAAARPVCGRASGRA